MNQPTVLLDTTVFCGALVKPTGINMRLLKLGATPLYKPIISQAVIAEFIHKACSDGIGKGSARRIYTPEEIAMFLEAFSSIVDQKQALAINQTYKFVSTFPGDTPTWVVISKFASLWPVDAILSEKLARPINQTDLGDFHVILAAIQVRPDVVVSSNIADLELLKNFCSVMTPGKFLNNITEM
jgi:predicted nucleic acid-binding protein